MYVCMCVGGVYIRGILFEVCVCRVGLGLSRRLFSASLLDGEIYSQMRRKDERLEQRLYRPEESERERQRERVRNKRKRNERE